MCLQLLAATAITSAPLSCSELGILATLPPPNFYLCRLIIFLSSCSASVYLDLRQLCLLFALCFCHNFDVVARGMNKASIIYAIPALPSPIVLISSECWLSAPANQELYSSSGWQSHSRNIVQGMSNVDNPFMLAPQTASLVTQVLSKFILSFFLMGTE
uniref:Uncharacterized protein n=1 Tax=Rousettus aegyptiacus TaxID=9407 RepID=A0A7J8DIE8_ROUAE|nr:hypothetical protein HJG63_008585 [Rousettus aegyptiacus]